MKQAALATVIPHTHHLLKLPPVIILLLLLLRRRVVAKSQAVASWDGWRVQYCWLWPLFSVDLQSFLITHH